MNTFRTFAVHQPVIFALSLTFVCFVLLLFVTGIAYSKLPKPYGDVATTMMRLVLTVGLLWLIWRLGGLEASGITRLGHWQVWLLAFVGMLYFAAASLYAFYGKPAFDVLRVLRSPDARAVILTQAASVLYEEILFRGVVLYVLFRAWGHTRAGTIGSVILTAVLFAIPHLMTAFMGVSLSATLLLIVETCGCKTTVFRGLVRNLRKGS
jgi:membrane protease YdiL (CAAX protease family)